MNAPTLALAVLLPRQGRGLWRRHVASCTTPSINAAASTLAATRLLMRSTRTSSASISSLRRWISSPSVSICFGDAVEPGR